MTWVTHKRSGCVVHLVVFLIGENVRLGAPGLPDRRVEIGEAFAAGQLHNDSTVDIPSKACRQVELRNPLKCSRQTTPFQCCIAVLVDLLLIFIILDV